MTWVSAALSPLQKIKCVYIISIKIPLSTFPSLRKENVVVNIACTMICSFQPVFFYLEKVQNEDEWFSSLAFGIFFFNIKNRIKYKTVTISLVIN